NGIAVNSTGYAYLVGSTSSSDFPITTKAYQKLLRGPQNAFVTLLNPSGPGFYYSTLFGGNGADAATGVALEPGCCNMSSPFDYVYITGSTTSSNLPTAAGVFQSAYRGAGDAF